MACRSQASLHCAPPCRHGMLGARPAAGARCVYVVASSPQLRRVADQWFESCTSDMRDFGTSSSHYRPTGSRQIRFEHGTILVVAGWSRHSELCRFDGCFLGRRGRPQGRQLRDDEDASGPGCQTRPRMRRPCRQQPPPRHRSPEAPLFLLPLERQQTQQRRAWLVAISKAKGATEAIAIQDSTVVESSTSKLCFFLLFHRWMYGHLLPSVLQFMESL